MRDEDKTKKQLIGELMELRRRVAELEALETGRKRAEEAPRRTEREKAIFLDAISEIVVYQDVERRVLWANRAAGESVGLAPERLVGRHCYEIWHQRSEPCVGCPVEKACETDQAQEGEMSAPDGRVWFVKGYPIRDANGDLMGAVEVTLEITERKALEETWRRYDFIVNTSRDFMSLINRNYAYEAVNESYCRAHNKTQEEIVGHNAADVWGEERYLIQIKEYLDKCFAGNEVHYQDWFEFAALGRRCFDVAYYPYYGREGTVTHVIVVSRDVTERERAEEALKRRNEELMALNSITAAVSRSLDLEEVLNAALEETLAVLKVEGGVIYCFDEISQSFAPAAHQGISQDVLLEVTGFKVGEGLSGRVAESGEPLVVADLAADLRNISAASTGAGWRSYAGVPIKSRDKVLGVMALTTHRQDYFRPDDVGLLSHIGNQIGVAIENAHLFGQVRAGRERLQNLSQQLVEAQETERRHIARELHDEIGQVLTVLKIDLQGIKRSPDALPFAARLEGTVGIVEQALQQVRNLSLDLRPSLLDDLGLVPALRWYVDRLARRAGLAVQFAADRLEKRLPADVETTCFRIVQEALTNVMRHAQAQQVSVELRRRDEDLLVVIRDDGVGFDLRHTLQRTERGASLGLLGMQERVHLVGGQIEIESAPTRGTEVRIRFPMSKA
jgi:PAS domain S-box-containing protein